MIFDNFITVFRPKTRVSIRRINSSSRRWLIESVRGVTGRYARKALYLKAIYETGCGLHRKTKDKGIIGQGIKQAFSAEKKRTAGTPKRYRDILSLYPSLVFLSLIVLDGDIYN